MNEPEDLTPLKPDEGETNKQDEPAPKDSVAPKLPPMEEPGPAEPSWIPAMQLPVEEPEDEKEER